MANVVSLLQYLQWGPPGLPEGEHGPSDRNTTNTRYNPLDISLVTHWDDFNLETIMGEFEPLLRSTTIPAEGMPTPSRPVRNEEQIKTQFKCYLDGRVRRSFRATFAELRAKNILGNRAIISFDEGTRAQILEKFQPDIAYFDITLRESTRENRAPGDIKPSWKWSLALRHGDPRQRNEFRKVLAQVNYDMLQNHSRYGFVITNEYLVAIRKGTARQGHLELSSAIPWTEGGAEDHPRLTVLLALWYLGMLAADNDGWTYP